MEVIRKLIDNSSEGDRILILYPDMYSFYIISREISEIYEKLLWLIWTDAGVERVDHIIEKNGFPYSSEAIFIGTDRRCSKFSELGSIDLKDLSFGVLKAFPLENRIIISFGINFLSIYGYDINNVIKTIIDHDSGILLNSFVGEYPKELEIFHDAVVTIRKNDNSYLSYYTYSAVLKFSMRGGQAVISDSFNLPENEMV